MTPPSIYGGTISEAPEMPQSTASPATTTRSALSLTYPGMTSRALSPGLGPASAGLEDLRPAQLHHGSQQMLPPSASAHHHLPQWQQQQQQHVQQAAAYPAPYTATGLATHSTGRPSWDMAPFPDHAPTGGGVSSAAGPLPSSQVIAYHGVERAAESGADSDDPQQHGAPASYGSQHHQTSRPH
jgi:hypothetical protein